MSKEEHTHSTSFMMLPVREVLRQTQIGDVAIEQDCAIEVDGLGKS